GHGPEALAAWKDLEPRLAARPERRAEAWRRIGELEEQRGDDQAALAAYRHGEELVPRGHYLRRELDEKLVGVYRRKDDVRSLIAERERQGPRSAEEWIDLGRLYDEVGDATRAMAALRKALAREPRSV